MVVFGNSQTGVSNLFWLFNLLLNQFFGIPEAQLAGMFSLFWLITWVAREGLQEL